MASYEEISQLKENERKLFDRQRHRGNSGEILKQRRNPEKKETVLAHVAGNVRLYVSSQDVKRSFFNKMDKAKV